MSKLIPTKEAFQVVDFGLSSIRQTTHGIRKALGKDIRRARKAKVDKRNFFQRAWDSARKKNTEGLIESKKKRSFIGGAVENIAQGTKGFFSKVVDAVGFLLIGYLGQKIPEIIEKVTKVISLLKGIGKFIWDFVSDVRNIGTKIIELVKQFCTNIKELNFTDEGGQLRAKMDEFGDAIKTLNTNWDNNAAAISAKIDSLTKDGEAAIAGTLNKSDQISSLQQQLQSGEITENEYKDSVQQLFQTNDVSEITDDNSSSSDDSSNDSKEVSQVETKESGIYADNNSNNGEILIASADSDLSGILNSSDHDSDSSVTPDGQSIGKVETGDNWKDQFKGQVGTHTKTTHITAQLTTSEGSQIMDLMRQRREMRSSGEHKTNPEKYANLKIKINEIKENSAVRARTQNTSVTISSTNAPDSLKGSLPFISSSNTKGDIKLNGEDNNITTIPIDVSSIKANNGTTVVNNSGSGNGGSSIVVVNNKNTLNTLKRLERHYT